MADLIIAEQEAALLREIARREHRPVEEVVSRMIAAYTKALFLSQDEQAIKAAEREVLTKIYAEARAYWRSIGDMEKLALTDEQLDEQFWCIDPDGIARMKSDEKSFQLPPDPLAKMAEMAFQSGESSEQSDISSRFDEALEDAVREELKKRQAGRSGE